jgi:apolipoprotein N-acyltransferase
MVLPGVARITAVGFVQELTVQFAMADWKISRLIAAVFLGWLSIFGWAPWGLWPVLLIAAGGLFWLVTLESQALSAGAIGLLYGLAMHLGVYGCLYPTLTEHMGVDGASAFFYTALVLLGLSLFTALPCIIYSTFRKRATGLVALPYMQGAVFASLFIVGEYLRVFVFARMSLLSTGYAFIDTWWAGFAPLLGSYALGWLGLFSVTFCVGAIARSQYSAAQLRRCGLAVLLLAIIGLDLQQKNWTEVSTGSMSLRLIQPQVEQSNLLDPDQMLVRSLQVVEQLTEASADISITSETAFPMYWNELPSALIDRMKLFSDQTGGYLLLGVATMNAQFKGSNSMLLLSPGVERLEKYNKVYLFPFGEYSPWGLDWLSKEFPSPRNDLISGHGNQKPFQVSKDGTILKIGTVMCNEILMSDVSRKWASDADVLINPANTAWFSQDIVIPQVLQISRMRALEVGRPVLHISNKGGSAVISSSGQILRALPMNQAGILNARVSGRKGETPYAKLGDWPILLFCFMSIGLGFVAVFSRRG